MKPVCSTKLSTKEQPPSEPGGPRRSPPTSPSARLSWRATSVTLSFDSKNSHQQLVSAPPHFQAACALQSCPSPAAQLEVARPPSSSAGPSSGIGSGMGLLHRGAVSPHCCPLCAVSHTSSAHSLFSLHSSGCSSQCSCSVRPSGSFPQAPPSPLSWDE